MTGVTIGVTKDGLNFIWPEDCDKQEKMAIIGRLREARDGIC